MNNLKAFLNPVKADSKQIVVSNRFLDDNGQAIPFTIRPLSQEINDRIQRKHMKKDKTGQINFNQNDYMNDLVAESVIYPDLENADLQQAYGAFSKTELIKKMLLAGEYMNLLLEVQKISDLTSEEDLIEEAKN